MKIVNRFIVLLLIPCLLADSSPSPSGIAISFNDQALALHSYFSFREGLNSDAASLTRKTAAASPHEQAILATYSKIADLKESGQWAAMFLSERLDWLIKQNSIVDEVAMEEFMTISGLRFNTERSILLNPRDAVEVENRYFRILSYTPNASKFIKLDIGIHDCIVVSLYDKRHAAGALIYPDAHSDVQKLFREALNKMQRDLGTRPAELQVSVVGGYAIASQELGLSILRAIEEHKLTLVSLDFLTGMDRQIFSDPWDLVEGDVSVALDVQTGQLYTLDFSEDHKRAQQAHQIPSAPAIPSRKKKILIASAVGVAATAIGMAIAAVPSPFIPGPVEEARKQELLDAGLFKGYLQADPSDPASRIQIGFASPEMAEDIANVILTKEYQNWKHQSLAERETILRALSESDLEQHKTLSLEASYKTLTVRSNPWFIEFIRRLITDNPWALVALNEEGHIVGAVVAALTPARSERGLPITANALSKKHRRSKRKTRWSIADGWIASQTGAIARCLINATRQIGQELHKRPHWGAPIMRLFAFSTPRGKPPDMNVYEYAEKVISGDIKDPAISFHLNNGATLVRIIENAYPLIPLDPELAELAKEGRLAIGDGYVFVMRYPLLEKSSTLKPGQTPQNIIDSLKFVRRQAALFARRSSTKPVRRQKVARRLPPTSS